MKKTGTICLVICIFLSMILPKVSATELLQETTTELSQEATTLPASAAYGCHSLDGCVPAMGSQKIIENMEAAFLYDVGSDAVIYAWNPDAVMHPASLVKIMTALIAVEQGTLTDAITVKEHVIATVSFDAVSADLLPNEVITLEDALYCLLVGSANDAAAVIADHVLGSQEAFVAEMNRYAQELGCKATVFTNPHGLHDPNQVTTARDVAKILNQAIKNETFMKFFSTPYCTVAATNLSEERNLSSNNFLINSVDNMRIYFDTRVTGGRTGVAQNGKQCLAVSAEKDGRKLISVIMGSESIYDEENYTTISYGAFPETSQLLTSGFDSYKQVQVIAEGQIFRQCAVENGKNQVVIGAKEAISSVLPVDTTAADLSYRYFDVQGALVAPIEKGAQISHVEVWHGNVCLAQADLFAMSAVQTAAADTQSQKNDGAKTSARGVFATIGVIALCVIAAVLGIRTYGKVRLALIKRRGRKYRESHRRSR